MLERILIFILLFVAGIGIIYFSFRLTELFGRITWAEYYLGGTRQAYVLAGFLLMFLSFLILFGVLDFSNTESIKNSEL